MEPEGASDFFMGSIRLRITWEHQKSRNLPAQCGEL